MELQSAGAAQYRRLLVVAAAAAAASALIGLVDAVRPLPVAWAVVRACLGLVLTVALVALLVRWLGARQRARGSLRGRAARLTVRQQWLLTAVLSVCVSAALIAAGFVGALVQRS